MSGTVAVVTGAARGMGRTHCVRLAEEGADVIALDLAGASDDLAQTAELVCATGRRCVTRVADVRDQDSLVSALAAGVAELGRLDVIVANAGIYADLALSWELSDEAWHRTLDINLTGVWHTVKAGRPTSAAAGPS